MNPSLWADLYCPPIEHVHLILSRRFFRYCVKRGICWWTNRWVVPFANCCDFVKDALPYHFFVGIYHVFDCNLVRQSAVCQITLWNIDLIHCFVASRQLFVSSWHHHYHWNLTYGDAPITTTHLSGIALQQKLKISFIQYSNQLSVLLV